MKKLILGFLLATAAFAQEWKPRQFFALGAGASSAEAPQAAGWAVFATELRPGFYSYSQATFVGSKPNTVETGVATKVMQEGRVTLLALGTAGAGFGDDNVGVSFSGGGAFHVKVYHSLGVLFGIRAQDSTITTVRPIYQIGICWGPPTN